MQSGFLICNFIDMQYKPINCSTYDKLEALAVQKTICVIQFLESDTETVISSKIKTLETINKEEFLILETGTRIRLDNIITLNGENLSGKC